MEYSCSVVSENNASVHNARSVSPTWTAFAWMSTVASGGVKVPSVSWPDRRGNSPSVATVEWRGERFASARVNELKLCDVRNSLSGRLATSLDS